MALHSDSHKQSILSKLDKLRKEDLLCDITLVVEDVHFKAHRALLAASSDYFSLLFTADRAQRAVYRLDGMEAEMFAAVLEFIYSAQVSVEPGATERLLSLARLMEVHELVEVLDKLAGSSAPRDEEIKADRADAQQPSKRKRGRPRKNVALHVDQEETAERPLTGDKDSDEELAEPHNKDDADYNPAACRQSRRRIKAPLKYKHFKAGGNAAAAGKDQGKRGRKRKYPNTEARCKDCDKVFKNHLFLKIHQRTHTGNLQNNLQSLPKFKPRQIKNKAQVFIHVRKLAYVLKIPTEHISTFLDCPQERSLFAARSVGRLLPRSTPCWLTSASTLEKSHLCVLCAPKHSPPNTPCRST